MLGESDDISARRSPETETLSTPSVEDAIADNVEGQELSRPKSVECPRDIVAECGGRFSCQLTTADGSTVAVNATQSDDSGKFDFDISR